MRTYNKIFLVSLPRHGTTTMATALGAIGIKTAHLGKIHGEITRDNHNAARIDRIAQQTLEQDYKYDILEKCDGMTDVPVPFVYKQLDILYPNSLFIHVKRPQDEWLSSYEKMSIGMDITQAKDTDQRLISALKLFRKELFGTEHFSRALMSEGYKTFYDGVGAYFKNRKNDFLEFDLSELTGQAPYKKLCAFLDCPTPPTNFPNENHHSIAPNTAFEKQLTPYESKNIAPPIDPEP